MDVVLEIAGDQIDGARDYQEDAFLITHVGDEERGDSKSSALVVMADGMGGHAAGNIASNLVVQTFNRTFTGKFGKEAPPVILRECLSKANGALAESIKETPALDGMGCTMVTAVVNRDKLYWLSVGDSHLYLIRNKGLEKKNADHSYGGYIDRMREQGVDVEPEPGLSRNMLMSAMTGDEIAEVDCPDEPFELEPGDRVIVCSDGLDTLSPGVIIQTSAWSSNARECVQDLLKAVEDANKPRQDNTTVIVVDVHAKEAPPAPEPAAPAEPTAAPEPATAPEPELESDARGGGKGLLIGIVVAVLAAAGVGGWLVLGGKEKEPAPAVESRDDEPAGVAQAPEAEAVPDEAPTAEPEPQPTEPEPEPESAPESAPEKTEPVAKEPTEEPATAEAEPAAPREFRDELASGGEGPVMVTIPGGAFQMGSAGHAVEAEERPRHEVRVEPFAMSKHEITFAQYERFANATGREVPDNMYLDKETYPVVFVSWDDALAYTRWLSEETGEKYRLPSEAEWEYAARAGTDTPYPWGFDIGTNNAHCFDCKTGLNPRQPTSIGRFDPNPFGLHDMAGNVAEWVHDCYHPTYEEAPTDGSVWEGGDCTYRVARGGSYSSTSKSLRSASRSKWRAQQAYDSVGIRVVREVR